MTEFGKDCVKSSKYVGGNPGGPMPSGILGAPIVSNGQTTAVKRSDNSGPPSMTHDINVRNAAARKSGSTYMAPKGK